MKRSYGQYCPLAKALDVIGGRWTLLMVRELSAGPRRFKDLLDGLPGIGTNLLSDRLRELQEGGVIEKRTLPPPAGSTVYELTQRGRALIPIAIQLAGWGFPLMGKPEAGEEYRVHWMMTLAKLAFRPEAAGDARLVCQMQTSGTDVAHFRIADGSFDIFHGPAHEPDLSLRGKPVALINLFTGAVSPEEATRDGVQLEGDLKTLRRLLGMFAPPPRSWKAA